MHFTTKSKGTTVLGCKARPDSYTKRAASTPAEINCRSLLTTAKAATLEDNPVLAAEGVPPWVDVGDPERAGEGKPTVILDDRPEVLLEGGCP